MSARILPFKRPVPKHDLVRFDGDATFDAAWEAMLAAHRCERSGTHDPEAIAEGIRQAEHALKLFDWCVGHFAREAMYGDVDAIDLESRARANLAATTDVREKLLERSRKPADVIPLPWVK